MVISPGEKWFATVEVFHSGKDPFALSYYPGQLVVPIEPQAVIADIKVMLFAI